MEAIFKSMSLEIPGRTGAEKEWGTEPRGPPTPKARSQGRAAGDPKCMGVTSGQVRSGQQVSWGQMAWGRGHLGRCASRVWTGDRDARRASAEEREGVEEQPQESLGNRRQDSGEHGHWPPRAL